MFGLIVLVVMLLYLALLVWATRRGWRWGIEKKGWRGKKRYLGAAIGFMIVYLPVFWDWLPTVAVHQYYCAKESGFWVYKTLEQWNEENPGVMERLVSNKARPPVQTPYGPAAILNQRFNYYFRYEGPISLNRWRIEAELRDSKDGDVIAREVGFSTPQERRQAGWSGWKFWLDSERCSIESHRDQGSFYKVMEQFEGAK